MGFFGDRSDDEFLALLQAEEPGDWTSEAARPAQQRDQDYVLRVLSHSPNLFWQQESQAGVAVPGGHGATLNRLSEISGGRAVIGDVGTTDDDAGRQVIRFSVHGRPYEFSPYRRDVFDANVCIILNRALAEAGVDGRFVTIGYGGSFGSKRTVYTPIGFFTSVQRGALAHLKVAHLNAPEPGLTTAQVSEFVGDLHSVDLFGTQRPDQVKARLKAALRAPVPNAESLLRHLGVTLSFDTECIDAPAENYPELIANLVELSKGELVVDRVSSVPSEDGEYVDLTLESDVHTRTQRLRWGRSDYADETFVWVANELLRSQNSDALFYRLRVDSQLMFIMYLTAPQHAVLEANPLLEFHPVD